MIELINPVLSVTTVCEPLEDSAYPGSMESIPTGSLTFYLKNRYDQHEIKDFGHLYGGVELEFGEISRSGQPINVNSRVIGNHGRDRRLKINSIGTLPKDISVEGLPFSFRGDWHDVMKFSETYYAPLKQINEGLLVSTGEHLGVGDSLKEALTGAALFAETRDENFYKPPEMDSNLSYEEKEKIVSEELENWEKSAESEIAPLTFTKDLLNKCKIYSASGGLGRLIYLTYLKQGESPRAYGVLYPRRAFLQEYIRDFEEGFFLCKPDI